MTAINTNWFFSTFLLMIISLSPVSAQQPVLPDNINVRNTTGESINLNQFLNKKNKEGKEVVMITSFNYCSYCIELAKAIQQEGQKSDINLEVILFINAKVGEGQGGKNAGFESYDEYQQFIQEKELQDLTHIHSQDSSFEQLVFKEEKTETPVIANIDEYIIYNYVKGYFPPQRGLDLPIGVRLDFHVSSMIDRIKSHQTGSSIENELTSGEYTCKYTFKLGKLISRTITHDINSDTLHQLKTVNGGTEAFYKSYKKESETEYESMRIDKYRNDRKVRQELYFITKENKELKLAHALNYDYDTKKKLRVWYHPNGQVCYEEKYEDGIAKTFTYDPDGTENDKGPLSIGGCLDYWKVNKKE